MNALFGARTLLHPFTGASGFLRGVTGGGRVSESARRGGGKERKLRPSSLGWVRKSRDIVAGRATRDAPQHDLEAAGLDLARLIAEFSVQDLAARHVLDIHRVTRARRGARCDCGESLAPTEGMERWTSRRFVPPPAWECASVPARSAARSLVADRSGAPMHCLPPLTQRYAVRDGGNARWCLPTADVQTAGGKNPQRSPPSSHEKIFPNFTENQSENFAGKNGHRQTQPIA